MGPRVRGRSRRHPHSGAAAPGDRSHYGARRMESDRRCRSICALRDGLEDRLAMNTRPMFAALLWFAFPALVAAAGDGILGTWITEGGESKVEVAHGGATYSGKVTWLKDGMRDGKPVMDAKNANPALRSRPLMGLEILSGFTLQPDGVWKSGTVYSPRKGQAYPAEISLTKDGRVDIKVKDGMFSRHVYWTR